MKDIAASVEAVMPQVLAWRRDIHQNPELSNREFRTSALVEAHLRQLGLEVRSGVAHTGVIGVLRGGGAGKVVALRADMDALPVAEEVDVPFASRVRTTFEGRDVGVMHACGHDAHTAVLMGVAELLSGMRDRIRGTVKFIFQPAEEGAPAGEEGGAELMVREGALEDPAVDAIFGLHVNSRYETGTIALRPGGMMAAVDPLRIRVVGKQSHGAYPWLGIDPVVVASQIVLGLQTIVSRQLNATVAPAIVTIGSIHGGVRGNIIPDEVSMAGTLRSLDPGMREELLARVRRTAEAIAAGAGATAEVTIERGYPMVLNDPGLTDRVLPTLRSVSGDNVEIVAPTLGAEDFSFFQQKVPGVFYYVGVRQRGVPLEKVVGHSPHFFVDETALPLAVKSLASVALEFLEGST